MNYRTSNRCFTPFTPNSKLQRKFQIPREKITPGDDGCDVFCDSFRVCRGHDDLVAWISSDYFESLLLLQLLRGENDSRQSAEIQANDLGNGD